ncbi:MAG: hypothetical protein Harvfovirus10_23 [Harvfovirus sp.]|uniref:Uncharacterized protein n=1 Tax=Harvfovirus sp. TaxID=2487768 RepID=A0A3G5A142_9VIRU|nr:MAG: hypothetical protein Harvfovirus10_23 [Harvfovirus sp.]
MQLNKYINEMENEVPDQKVRYMDWEDAESFEDLCHLMENAFDGVIDSFVSYKCEATNSILVEESMKYKDEFCELNSLGFLTLNSQPGLIEVRPQIDFKLYNNPETPLYFKKTIPKDMMIYQQRNYVEGLIEKRTFDKILHSLYDYIILLYIFADDNISLKMTTNYEKKRNKHLHYVFIPERYKSFSRTNFCDWISGANTFINLSRKIYSVETNPCTNSLVERGSKDVKHSFREFKPSLSNWLIDNVYYVNIIDPEYGQNNLNQLLLSLLDKNFNSDSDEEIENQ